eukprot:scaffold90812_cov19-Tisochrysis_lutea.AAC.1
MQDSNFGQSRSNGVLPEPLQQASRQQRFVLQSKEAISAACCTCMTSWIPGSSILYYKPMIPLPRLPSFCKCVPGAAAQHVPTSRKARVEHLEMIASSVSTGMATWSRGSNARARRKHLLRP